MKHNYWPIGGGKAIHGHREVSGLIQNEMYRIP